MPALNKSRQKSARWWKESVGSCIYSLPQGDIVCGDALEFLNALREESADIIFLDPPFNLGKRYGRKGTRADLVEDEAYISYLTSIIERSALILKEGGALYLYHLPRWAFRLANVLERHLTFRHWIAISMKNGFVRGTSLYPAHYSLLYFTKGKPSHFLRPKLEPPRCRHCDEYIKDYGGYKKFISNGINLSDFWEDLSPVRHKKFKHRKPNELPLEIPRRAVKVSGAPRGVLVDPFAGAGTSLVAAVEAKMRFVACDLQPAYCKLMYNRVLKELHPGSNSSHRRTDDRA
jgi:site-specific DNA-methyltransferase (adenine-specific)